MAERLLDRLLRPRIVFGTLIVVVIVANLFLPDAATDDASGTLSSLSYDRSGIRGWYEGSSRLGWAVKRREERFHGTLPDSAVYVVVDPDIEPTAAEVGVLLGAVRRGAGLIVSAQRRSPLADSLHLYSDDWQYSGYPVVGGAMPAGPLPSEAILAAPSDTAAVDTTTVENDTDDEWIGGDSVAVTGSATADTDTADAGKVADSEARSDSLARATRRRNRVPTALAAYSYHIHAALTATRPLPRDTSVFLSVVAMSGLVPSVKPAALGMPLGAGRVVVLADPGILRNGLLDEQKLVVFPQRLLEWVAPSERAPLIFDEYHHGMGRHGSTMRAVRNALGRTTVGRAGLQIMLAGLVLLLALGARPIAPRARMRLERRSPLEHVGALSRAYMQKGATRLAARRLVHGLRRRHGAAARGGDDETFLRRLTDRHPALKPSVERLIAATQHPVSPREFTLLADDVDSIERTLRT